MLSRTLRRTYVYALAFKSRAQFSGELDCAWGVAMDADCFAIDLDILPFDGTHLAFAQHPQHALSGFLGIMKQCILPRARNEPAVI
jgi:hypothetical protein